MSNKLTEEVRNIIRYNSKEKNIYYERLCGKSIYYFELLMTEQNNTTIFLPKIKKTELCCKIMLDPADFRRGLPKNRLPELTDKGLILSLKPQKAPLARMNHQGTLKLNIRYTGQILCLIDRYIEVKVIDNYDDVWIGTFFGIVVRGTGGEGLIRGCRVKKIQNSNLIVEGVSQGGLQSWQKLVKKIELILEEVI